MAKLSSIEKTKKINLLVKKFSDKRIYLKQNLVSESTYSAKLPFLKKLHSLPRNSAAVRLRNRCWSTGRSRAFFRDFGLSRHVLREMAHEGLVPGLKKSSW
jgi:small subunit ribosomal protein S14